VIWRRSLFEYNDPDVGGGGGVSVRAQLCSTHYSIRISRHGGRRPRASTRLDLKCITQCNYFYIFKKNRNIILLLCFYYHVRRRRGGLYYGFETANHGGRTGQADGADAFAGSAYYYFRFFVEPIIKRRFDKYKHTVTVLSTDPPPKPRVANARFRR